MGLLTGKGFGRPIGFFFVLYFAVFYILIRALDLKTPGREDAAELTGVDMEEAVAKYAGGCPRCGGTPCSCPEENRRFG